MTWALICLAWAALVDPSTASAREEACVSARACHDAYALAAGDTIPLYRSRPLAPNPAIERAVVVIHGNRRDPDRYFEALAAAATLESRLADTLLLAPGFQTVKDSPVPGQLYWSSSGWKIGDRARNGRRISSFAVLDELLGTICPAESKIFPMLRTVVIIGHSAGGQFVQRYAAGGRGCDAPEVEVRYVVMNPSSYLYVDGRRRAEPDAAFRVWRFGCFDYDDYKYGLRDLNRYMTAVGPERIRAQLAGRTIYYLAGEKDDDPRSSSLDKSCEANRQGAHRLDRFRNYRDYVGLFEDWRGSTFHTIPGVGHSARKMLASETARRITFR